MRNTFSSRTSIVEAECVRINDVDDESCDGPSEYERQRTGGHDDDGRHKMSAIAEFDVAGYEKWSIPDIEIRIH